MQFQASRMDIQEWPFEGTSVFRDAQMKSLSSAEPLAVRVVEIITSEESLLPNMWAVGGILMALMATVASIITGARMIRLKLQEKRTEQEGLVRNESTILSSVSLRSPYEDEGIEMPSCSYSPSNLFPSEEIRLMKRKKRRETAMKWRAEDPSAPFIAREPENWATLRGYEMEARESTKKKSNCFWSEFSNLDERRPVPALFRPLLESFSKMEEYEGEEMLNTNFKHAWELGKSKLRQWQQENLPSFAVRGPYNSLFGREDVVKLWDNLKGRALRTFYVQQGFASAMDSGWISSLGNTSQELLSLWDLQGFYMEPSNTIITGGPDESSGKMALKVWDARMGSRPAAVNEPDLLVPRRIIDMKSGHLHKLYIKDDAKRVSIHELRMLGEGPISTLTLEDSTTIPGEQNFLSDGSFAEMEETEERGTWWDADAVIVSDEEESVSDDDEEDDCYDIEDDHLQPNNDSNKKSVVSWCLGAVRSISSSLGKQEL